MARRWQYQVRTDTLQTAIDIVTKSWVGTFERWQEPSVYLQARRSAEFPQPVIPWQPVIDIVTNFWVGTFERWQEPSQYLVPRRTAHFEYTTPVIQPTIDLVKLFGWARTPWTEPVRILPRTPYFETTTLGVPPVDQFGWARTPWVDPNVLAKARTAQFQDLAFVQVVTTAGFTTFWLEPWSEPVRTLSRTPWFDPAPYFETQQFPESVTIDRWLQPWSEPSVKTKPRATDFPFIAFQAAPSPFAATGWYEPWVDPVRTPPRAADFWPQAYFETQQFPETVTIDRWLEAWSEPVRRQLRAADFSAFAQSLVTTEVVTLDKWFKPWLDPVRVVARSPWFMDAEQFQLQPVIDIVTKFGWAHTPWSEPVRIPQRVADFPAAPYFETQRFPESVTIDRWLEPWSEPVRQPLRAADFPATPAWSTFTPPVVAFTTFFFTALSEPVRTPPPPMPKVVLGFQAGPENLTIDRWYQPWNDPVRAVPRAVDFPNETLPYVFVEPILADKWHKPWVDPVRVIPLAAFFDFTTPSYPIQPVIDIAAKFGWTHTEWEYPQAFLQKRGLGAYEQQSLMQTVIPQVIATTGTMAATEPFDKFAAAGFNFSSPATAIVGIHQNLPITPS